MEWLEICDKNKCEIVVSPENTLSFLQTCDQFVNKTFKKRMPATREEFAKSVILDTRSVRFNHIVVFTRMIQ